MNRKSFLKLGFLGAIFTPIIGFCKGTNLKSLRNIENFGKCIPNLENGMVCNLSYIKNLSSYMVVNPILLKNNSLVNFTELTSFTLYGDDEEILESLIKNAALILAHKDGLSLEDKIDRHNYLCERFGVKLKKRIRVIY